MNKKIITIIVVLIVIVGLVGLLAFQNLDGKNENSQLITVTYTTHSIASTDHWYISNSSMVTNIIVVTLFNSSKNVPLYTEGTSLGSNDSSASNGKNYPLTVNDFYLTSNGGTVSTCIATMNNETFVSGSSGFAVSRTFDFTVRGNVSSYQLAYNGTQDVKIILKNP